MIYLLTAIGLTPGGSSTVHIYTQTIHRTTQLTTWKAFWDSNPECCCIDRDRFVNCNSVDTRWQQYSIHLHKTIHRTTQLTTWKALWDSNPECSCIDRDIFVNCNSVDTRWQQYSTHLHTDSTQNNTINNLEGFVGFEPRVLLY